jgi:cytochrome c oxidase subunit 2
VRGFAARLTAVALAFGACGYFAASAQQSPPRIELVARKFDFGTAEVRLKKGQPVTFVLSAQDFVHGFSVPDFNVRVDVVPSKRVEVTITPDKAGKFHFLCDNFCGEDHDKMGGFLIVTD